MNAQKVFVNSVTVTSLLNDAEIAHYNDSICSVNDSLAKVKESNLQHSLLIKGALNSLYDSLYTQQIIRSNQAEEKQIDLKMSRQLWKGMAITSTAVIIIEAIIIVVRYAPK